MVAPKACAIYEIIDKDSIPVHRYVENLALQIGQSFHCVICDDPKRKKTEASSAIYEFEVDPAALIDQLKPHL